jgi:hypothetical protein
MPRSLLLLGLVGLALTGCNDPFAILPATRENRVDTLELYAANGTALTLPSGYAIVVKDDTTRKGAIRIGLDPSPIANAPPFDFLYRIDAVDGPQFAVYGAVAPSSTSQTTAGRPGLQTSTQRFDDITEGQQIGYTVDEPINLTVGLVLFARSALPNNCFLGIPYYAKIEIISFDDVKRSVKFRALANTNCGYRGLLPGIPER